MPQFLLSENSQLSVVMHGISNFANTRLTGSRIANPNYNIGLKPLGALSLTKQVIRAAAAQ